MKSGFTFGHSILVAIAIGCIFTGTTTAQDSNGFSFQTAQTGTRAIGSLQ